MGSKRPGGGLSAVQQSVKFLGVSVLAGAVLAGLALPAVGALGLAAKGTIQGFDELPADLTRPPLSQKNIILDADGGKIAEDYARNRTVVPLDEISPHMQAAIIAIEDARFYEHGAVDLRGLLRAANNNLEQSGTTQGGSTLTQQYVKNVFVEAAGDDEEAVAEATRQEIGRKIRELKYAIQLEQELGKDQILENYLNITFFGQQAYGVEAAAQRYFSKSAADLEVHEAALLAGLVQSPTRYDPISDDVEATKRRNTVLQRMVETGDLTQEEADEAKALDLGLNVSRPKTGCITAAHDAGFFCDYVRQQFLSNPIFGETRSEREARWKLGGLTIRTTLRPQAQSAAAGAARNGALPEEEVAAAVVQVEPGTGHIVSMAQSRPYGTDPEQHQTMLNYNVSSLMGGTSYGFQPGSTVKPFTAAAALEAGVSPAKTYSSGHEIEVDEADFTTCEGGPAGDKKWKVPNESENLTGTWDMTEALGKSVNTYFVMLQREVGLCETVTMADQLGVRRGEKEATLKEVPSLTLGTEDTTPLMMANAYATFANEGVYCEPVAILEITDADGAALPVPETECRQVMSQATARTINMMLKGVVEDGTGQQVGLTDRENAGKTGTTDERKNVWFVGYTPDLSTAVRVGGDGGTLPPMVNMTIGGVFREKAGGSTVAGPIWREAMQGALAGVPASEFTPIDLPRADDEDDDEDDRDEDGDRDDGRPGRPGGNGNGNGNGNGRGDWDWDWDWTNPSFPPLPGD